MGRGVVRIKLIDIAQERLDENIVHRRAPSFPRWMVNPVFLIHHSPEAGLITYMASQELRTAISTKQMLRESPVCVSPVDPTASTTPHTRGGQKFWNSACLEAYTSKITKVYVQQSRAKQLSSSPSSPVSFFAGVQSGADLAPYLLPILRTRCQSPS